MRPGRSTLFAWRACEPLGIEDGPADEAFIRGAQERCARRR